MPVWMLTLLFISCSHFDILRPRGHLTVDQWLLEIVRLQTGCSQREVAAELRVSSVGCNRKTGRVPERHRCGNPLATSDADDPFIVRRALQTFLCCGTPTSVVSVCFHKLFVMKKLPLHASTSMPCSYHVTSPSHVLLHFSEISLESQISLTFCEYCSYP